MSINIDLIPLYIGIFSILGIISIILYKLHVDELFILSFFFLGSIISSAGPYDCFRPAIPYSLSSNGWYLPLVEFWIWLGVVIPATFIISYVLIQKTYTDKIDKERTKVYSILIIGIVLTFIPIENLLLYLYRGFQYYNPSYSCYQTIWFNDLFPVYYIIAIPGIILTIYAFIWSVKNPVRREK